jgi:hypothetical protein
MILARYSSWAPAGVWRERGKEGEEERRKK